MSGERKSLGPGASTISRREFLGRSVAAAAAMATLPQEATAATKKETKPNILFIIVDHQAFYGHNRESEFEYKWPVFEKFCSQGVRFNRAYSVCPLCTPARSSILTGVYPSSHGLMWNTDYADMHDFRDGQKLYTDYLSQAGYRNAYVGKWHCGKNKLAADFGMEGWSLPDYGKVYMSDAYKSYAAQRQLGDARARIEYDLYHPGWNGKTLTLHHPSPWRFMNASGVLIGPAKRTRKILWRISPYRNLESWLRRTSPGAWSPVSGDLINLTFPQSLMPRGSSQRPYRSIRRLMMTFKADLYDISCTGTLVIRVGRHGRSGQSGRRFWHERTARVTKPTPPSGES